MFFLCETNIIIAEEKRLFFSFDLQ